MLGRAILLVLLSLLAPLGARAQERECTANWGQGLTEREGDLLIIHSRFEVTCTDGVILRADSGTVYQPTSDVTLVGNVFFQDTIRTLTSQQATYSKPTGRLYATGDVVFVDEAEGMTLRGPELEYLTAMPPERPEPLVNAGQRPHLTLEPRESAKDTVPLEIDGDRIALAGRNDLSVFGNVVIARPDMRATAGQARYDGTAETLALRDSARIESDEYTLAGDEIDARMPGGELERVDARERASLAGKDLTVTAPELHLLFEDGLLQHTVARGDSTTRPRAVSETFRLVADSLDAKLPGQKLREVVAIGNARGESIDTTTAEPTSETAPDTVALGATPPDSAAADTAAAPAPPAARAGGVARSGSDSAAVKAAAAELTEHDWIVGDTIIGYFVSVADSTAGRDSAAAAPPAARPDSAGTAPDTSIALERIVARGSAQSLYHLEENRDTTQADSTVARPGINFLAGDVIDLRFEGGELRTAQVEGLKKGLYLDPAEPTAKPDTSAEGAAEPTTEPDAEPATEPEPEAQPEIETGAPAPPPVGPATLAPSAPPRKRGGV
jgi:lipopolysaccharide export system protein LptA